MELNLCSPPKVQRTVCIPNTTHVPRSSSVVINNQPCPENIKLSGLQCNSAENEVTQNSFTASQSEKMGMSSTAMVLNENSNTEESISDIEAKLLDGAIDNLLSLPQEVSKVAEMQKEQSNEIQKHEIYLQSLQNQLFIEREKCNEVYAEISTVTRKICMIEEHSVEEKKQIVQLEKEISKLIHQQNQLKYDIETKKKDLEEQTQQYEEYKIKMEDYQQQVSEFEQTLPAQQQLNKIEKHLTELENRKNVLKRDCEFDKGCADSVSKKMSESINCSREKIKETETQLNEVIQNIKNVLEQQEKVKIATNVLNKRNAAQLTRLKRQVKEQQLRHRQWSDQREQLQKSVEEHTNRLNE